jgi:putative tRNA adenosine deaminase-associated protein
VVVSEQIDGVDFALAAYREEGVWQVDITAAEEWELASSAVDALGLPEPEDDDEQAPAGDLDILGDLGMGAMDMGVLLDDFDLYPDEMLSDVARRLGFGPMFDDAVGLTSA